MAVLSRGYRIITSEPGLIDFLIAFRGVAYGEPQRLPECIESAIRDVTRHWPTETPEPLTAICYPVPGLVVHVASLCGPDGCCIAATFEPLRARPSAHHASVAFGLSEREAEIAQLLVNGMSGAEIARHLNIAYNTVHEHLKHIHVKLNVSTRGELISRLLDP
jgi:DNA-binding CsgD family transcriptional regulator